MWKYYCYSTCIQTCRNTTMLHKLQTCGFRNTRSDVSKGTMYGGRSDLNVAC